MRSRRQLLAGFSGWAVGGVAWAQTAPAANRFESALATHDRFGGAGLMIARHGRVWLSTPGDGHSPDTRHDLGEATGALLAPLAAALVWDEVMTLDEPVALSLGAFGLDPFLATMPVRALLDLTVGIGTPAGSTPTVDQCLALVGGANRTFLFSPAGHQLFAEVVRRKLMTIGEVPDVAVYLQNRVLGPYGLSALLQIGPDGLPSFAEGGRMRTEDLFRLGELVRLHGLSRARFLLSPQTLEGALVGSAFNPRYGFGWHLAGGVTGPIDAAQDQVSDLWRSPFGSRTRVAFVAGAAGQRLYILPQLGITIARTSAPSAPAGWSDSAFLDQVLQAL